MTEIQDFFKASDLEWMPQTVKVYGDNPNVVVLCYIQARAIQKRLDDVYGIMGWKDEYRHEGNGWICRLSVYDKESGQWVSKENGAPETDIESYKGGISSAFKRVASSGFGIGRYLYELETTKPVCKIVDKFYKAEDGWVKSKVSKSEQYVAWKIPSIPKEFLPKFDRGKVLGLLKECKDVECVNVLARDVADSSASHSDKESIRPEFMKRIKELTEKGE